MSPKASPPSSPPSSPVVKITKIETRFVSIPLAQPLITATFPIEAIDTVAVRVRTDQGIDGLGWVFAFGRGRVKGIQMMIEDLGALLIGEDALMLEQNWHKLWRANTFIGHSGAAVIAMSPLDTALWDIAAKAAGLPLYKMLGGYRDKVEAYASEGLWLHQSIDELQDEAQKFRKRGFRGMKMRVGKADLAEDVERTLKVREAAGADAVLMVDANQAWDVPTAIRYAREVEEADLLWIEEPVGYQNYDGMARIAAATDTPLCVGETNYTTEDFKRLILEECGHYIMPDLMRMGGVGEWMKVARLAEAFHLPVTPHLFMEVSAHQAAASPNAVWQEHQPWWEPVWKEPVDFRDSFIHLRDKPGLGVEWDDKALAKYEVK